MGVADKTADKTMGTGRARTTRELILRTAERLFAEQGVYAVSNRQIGEAAAQGNTAVVGYHFGTKTDLVRAITRKHMCRIDQLRTRHVAQVASSGDIRDWVACIVCPVAEHLAALDSPACFARFGAQVLTSPALREIMADEAFRAPSLIQALDGLNRCLPDLPAEVRAERNDMVHQLLIHGFAERERALTHGTPTPRDTWCDAASGLIDAITGLWLAPVTPPGNVVLDFLGDEPAR